MIFHLKIVQKIDSILNKMSAQFKIELFILNTWISYISKIIQGPTLNKQNKRKKTQLLYYVFYTKTQDEW